MIFRILPYETTEMVLQNTCFNAVGVVLLIAQGCQTIVQATLGLRRLYGEQRCKCCTFSAQFTIYFDAKKRES